MVLQALCIDLSEISRPARFVSLTPGIRASFDLLIRFEYVTIPLCIMSGTGFLLALIPSEGFRRISVLVGIGTLFTLIPLPHRSLGSASSSKCIRCSRRWWG